MKELYGVCISSGKAEGALVYYKKNKYIWEPVQCPSSDEMELFERAAGEVIRYMSALAEKALQTAGRAISLLFESYGMMTEEMGNQIKKVIIEKGISAEEATVQVNLHLVKKMELLEDDYMKARAADIREIGEYLLSSLFRIRNGETVKKSVKKQGIWFADAFTPGDILEFGKTHAFAFVTGQDMRYTHTAVVAAAYGIPFIGGIPYQSDWNECFAKLDAQSGILYIEERRDEG